MFAKEEGEGRGRLAIFSLERASQPWESGPGNHFSRTGRIPWFLFFSLLCSFSFPLFAFLWVWGGPGKESTIADATPRDSFSSCQSAIGSYLLDDCEGRRGVDSGGVCVVSIVGRSCHPSFIVTRGQ